MQCVADILNEREDSGIDLLRIRLDDLRQATFDNEAQQLKEFGLVVESGTEALGVALNCVRGILSNIISHPDDEKLRRIRINHPVIRVS